MTYSPDSADARLAVEQLYLAHHRPITAYLARLVGDRETAEDLCQETFLKAMRGWAGHDPQASAVGWLYRIATNAAYDNLRRGKILRWTSLDAAASISGEASQEQRLVDRATVRAALACLPPSYRAALLLACVGYSAGEMAGALGCSDTAIRMRLYRARAQLREIGRAGV
jgi:RNA polymerase sigma-70 factor, ECF subfamily